MTATDRFSLAGRVALVTGGGRGLGKAIALGLAEAGANLVLCGRSGGGLAETADSARELGREALPVVADVSRVEDVRRLVDATVERFDRLDVLVNNAGISPVFKRAEALLPAEWQQIIDVNLTGTFLCCQAVGTVMLGQGRGVIVNLSSTVARSAFTRLSAYAASKAGVEALTRSLALEWAARGVRVNAIGPAFFETDMTEGVRGNAGFDQQIRERTPMKRMGLPDEVVGAVVFLASDASTYLTGQVVYIDGGWSAS